MKQHQNFITQFST